MDETMTPVLDLPPNEAAELEAMFAEMKLLNAKIASDDAEIKRLRRETAELKAETDRVRDETREILDRIRVLVPEC